MRLFARPKRERIKSLTKAANMNPAALEIQIVDTTAYPMPYQSSMYGISAPGAESFNPFPKYSEQAARTRHLFIFGYDQLGTTFAASCCFGVGGWLRSSSLGV